LNFIAALRAQSLQALLSLNVLRSGAHSQRVAEPYDGFDHGRAFGAGFQLADERSIDLDLVEGEALQKQLKLEQPVPKSSIQIRTPRSCSCRKVVSVASVFCNKPDSIISSSRQSAGTPDVASALSSSRNDCWLESL
jgi:hypothetical protein